MIRCYDADPREKHVILVEYDEIIPPPMPPPMLFRGPSVYTREEEELIATDHANCKYDEKGPKLILCL